VDVIDQDIDLPSDIELYRSNQTYDPRVMADNSGVTYQAVPHDRKQADLFMKRFMKNASLLRCPKCSGETFRVMADDHDDQALIMLVCRDRECGACWAPMKIQVAQMTPEILKQHGVWLPS
jgi:hypothetical protein